MVDIEFAAAEIRQGKKKNIDKNRKKIQEEIKIDRNHRAKI